MSRRKLLATDNGFVVREQDDGTYEVVWSGSFAERGFSGANHEYEGEIVGFGPNSPAFNAPEKITAWSNTEDIEYPLYTSDGGKTWTLGSMPTVPAGFNFSSIGNPPKDGTYNTLVDEQGRVYVTISQAAAPNHSYLARSTDHTFSELELVADIEAITDVWNSMWVGDGYIWFIITGRPERHSISSGLPHIADAGHYKLSIDSTEVQIEWNDSWASLQTKLNAAFGDRAWTVPKGQGPYDYNLLYTDAIGSASGAAISITENTLTFEGNPVDMTVDIFGSTGGEPTTLWRLDLEDGASPTSFPITVDKSAYRINQFILNGTPGTDRLVAWSWDDFMPIMTIDITDPDAPAIDWSDYAPFGEFQLASDVVPVTNQVIIANTYNDDVDELDEYGVRGAIWRSADGGATWGNVVAETTRLGQAQDPEFVGADNEINAIAVDPKNRDNLCVALSVPYVYHSEDMGLTWDFDTVDLSIFDDYLTHVNDEYPHEWTGVTFGAQDFPGLSRFQPSDLAQQSFSVLD